MRAASDDAAPPWSCPTCGAAVRARYCGACGERRLEPGDLRVLALFAQAFESLTHTDGRVFRTFKALLLRPGELTLAYAQGRRKSYIAPFQVFLITNVVFFFGQSLLGFQALSNTFRSHVENQVYSARVLALATERLAAAGVTREAYEPVFDHAVDVNAKALVVLWVPFCALLIWVMSLGAGRRGAVHWVFALHLVAFWLVVLAAILPLVGFTMSPVLKVFGLGDAWLDAGAAWLIVALSAVWAYHAFGRVYGGTTGWRAFEAAFLAFALLPLIRVYRLAVFLMTLYTTT